MIFYFTRILKILKMITPLCGYTYLCIPYCGSMYNSITS